MDDSPTSMRFMDFLLFRSFKGRTAPSEEEAVEEWRNEAPENDAYFRETARLLQLTAEAGRPPRGQFGPPPDGASMLRAAGLGEALESEALAEGTRRRRRSRLRRMALTATVAASLIGVVFLGLRGGSSPESLSFGADEFVTGRNDVVTVTLRDGTVVRLAPESRLRITGSLGSREVVLEGRAFFAVPRTEGGPFVVRSQAGDAVVLGTRFDAEARGDELRLLVVEGRVALTSSRSRVELNAGEMGRAVQGALSSPIPVADPYRELAWMGDFLVFEATPIRQVAREIERHFGTAIDVQGTNLDSQTVTASFADTPAEDVLRVVCRVLAAECSIRPDGATILLLSPSELPRRSES